MNKNETVQNYLEAIYILSLEKENLRAIDIVKYLKYSRPTVSIALKSLEKSKYIETNQTNISLTKKGLDIAKAMYERHELFAQILMSIGVSKKQAYEDSCLIEHDLSKESFEAIKKHFINNK